MGPETITQKVLGDTAPSLVLRAFKPLLQISKVKVKVTVKVEVSQCMQLSHTGRVKVWLHSFLILALVSFSCTEQENDADSRQRFLY